MIRVAYVGMSNDYKLPGDRRRFSGFAKYSHLKIENFKPNKKYDLIVLSQKADLSYFYKLDLGNTKIIFDFIDAYLHETLSIKQIFRGLLKYLTGQNKFLHLNYKNLIIKICRKANYIICTSEAQKKEIRKYNKNVEIILDAHQKELGKISVKSDNFFLKKKKIDLLWEGQGGNIISLKRISHILSFYIKRNQINLHIVSDPKFIKISGTNVYGNTKNIIYKIMGFKKNIFFYDWSVSNLKKVSQKCDFGIIPMFNYNNGMYAHKPANKLHLLWRLGLPSLVSPSPSIKKSVIKSKTNLLCFNDKDWKNNLDNIMMNKKKNLKLKKKVKKYIEKEYSDKKIFSLWNKVLTKTIYVK